MMCQDVVISGNAIQEERVFGSSPHDSSPEVLSRRSSISSVDSGNDTPSARSRINSASSNKQPKLLMKSLRDTSSQLRSVSLVSTQKYQSHTLYQGSRSILMTHLTSTQKFFLRIKTLS
jgi:hypothetical protein